MEHQNRASAGRLRALWLVPLMVSSAAIGGGIYAPATAHAATTGSIEICKSASNGMGAYSFNFTVKGYVGTIAPIRGGTCSGPLTVSAGRHKVTETATPGFGVQTISTVPANALKAQNDAAGTAGVMVTAGADTIVTYTNQVVPAQLKVCKQAAADSTQLNGQPFSFTINGGAAFTVNAGPYGSPNCSSVTTFAAGTNVTVNELAPASNVFVAAIDVTQPPATNVSTSLSGRSATLTVGAGVNIVTFTNGVKASAQPGYLEICKYASDQFVSGAFTFNVTDAAGVHLGPFSVQVGQCTSPIQLTAGPATITETGRFPYVLSAVDATPSGRLISQNDSNGTAVVNIVAGDQSTETIANFTNDTQSGQVKVCKTLSSNSAALAGTTFTFPWTSSAGNKGTVSIVAAAPGQSACVFITGPLANGFPLGSAVSISETGQPNVLLTGVSVVPASADNGSTSTTANIIVIPGVAIATFTNEALGTIEVCKNAADASTATQTFQFSLNGGAPFNVHANQCSMPISVAAGTATVQELGTANFHLVSVTASGPAGDNRIVGGTNPVTVSVPFGGVSNETIVTFTNAVNTGQFKVCKTSADPALSNITFNFQYNATFDGSTVSGTAALMPGQCSSLSAPIPVVDSHGNPVQLNVSEAPTAGVLVNTITYQGAGALLGSNTTAGTASIAVGQGSNVVTYDNERVPVV